jgi:hypothetical protein
MAKRDPYTATKRTEPFNNREMQAMADVSLMSLYLWKKGSTKRAPIPYSKAENGTVRYPVKSSLRWLKRHGIELLVHPDDVNEHDHRTAPEAPRQRRKPGPVHARRSAERASARA